MWFLADIADAVEAGLRARERVLVREQAVAGLDALEEVALHPVIAGALETAGYGVHREQRYPADRRRRRDTEGERCDFVLTPDGLPLVVPDQKATLFEPGDAVDPEDAFWLECKVVAQYTELGANRHYASNLLSTVHHDVTKLAKDAGILHAGLLLVLFVREPVVADHDLGVWQDRCLERMLPIGAPYRRTWPIPDRLGNAHCAIAVYPVSHL